MVFLIMMSSGCFRVYGAEAADIDHESDQVP